MKRLLLVLIVISRTTFDLDLVLLDMGDHRHDVKMTREY